MIETLERKTQQPVGAWYAASAAARWIAAAIAIFYGFAKVNGAQFTVIDSEVAKPLGDVSGFWLTWYYFSFSPTYGTLVAMLQIVGGILLTVPRTALIGALVLLPVAANIVLIDIFFGIRALVPAILLLACLLVIVAEHARPLIDVILIRPKRVTLSAPVRLIGATMLVAAAFAFSWWVANFNNRRPTAIDGVWTVVGDARAIPYEERWNRVFFERNRAHMAVFRRVSGKDDVMYFEMDSTGTVRVRQTYTRTASIIMEGRATEAGGLDLEVVPGAGGGHLRLERVQGGLRPLAGAR